MTTSDISKYVVNRILQATSARALYHQFYTTRWM